MLHGLTKAVGGLHLRNDKEGQRPYERRVISAIGQQFRVAGASGVPLVLSVMPLLHLQPEHRKPIPKDSIARRPVSLQLTAIRANQHRIQTAKSQESAK